jgi:23S rRNA pseudouridine955/2504/2580 synthase
VILKQFTVPDALDGQTLAAAVGRMLPLVRGACIREAFKRRDVKADGVRTPPDAPAHAGMAVSVYLREGCELAAPSILFADERLAIIDKPAGVSCEADNGGGLPIGALMHSAYPDRFTAPLLPCHRLDNQTRGLLILARDGHTSRLMEQAFRERAVQKRYECLVRGTPTPEHAVLDSWLVKDAQQAVVTVLNGHSRGAVPIRTAYEVLAPGDVARLLVTLHTGRTHQIRAHMAYIGHPLLGDDKYGDRAFNRLHHARRLMLNATELAFTITGELAYLNDMLFTLEPDF